MSQIPKLSKSIQDYQPGDLSVFPEDIDSLNALYLTGNLLQSRLLYSLDRNNSIVFLDNDPGFPSSGVVKIGREYIYYGAKSGKNQLINVIRDVENSGIVRHDRNTNVELVIMADHHNVLRDSIWNLQRKVGILSDPADIEGNLSQRVSYLYDKWWKPRALWFAKTTLGTAPHKVQFFSFSRGFPDSYYWEFGDGTSLSGGEEAANPIHIYEKPGTYSVSLTVFSNRRGSASGFKIDYVTVTEKSVISNPTIWVESSSGNGEWGPGAKGRGPLTVRFIDQTNGIPLSRHWHFGDSSVKVTNDPYDINAVHTYTMPGKYEPTLFIQTGPDKTLAVKIPLIVEVLV